MTFASPLLLLLLLLLPPLLLLKRRSGDGGGAGGFSNLGLLAFYKPTWRQRYRWLPTAVRTAAIVLLVIAIARPQIGQADSEIPGQGIDIAFVLDTSSSMSVSMGDDSRMVVAKRVLSSFIEERTNDQLGLVIFRSNSLVLSPMTFDYEALAALVDEVDQINIPDGTAIGTGLSDGLNLLRDSRARSRAVILLTDGENNSGQIEPLQAARIAQTMGVRVYIVGVLDPGARGRGQVNVDERALQEMAALTGGRYFPAEDETGLSMVVESIDQLEKSLIGRPQFVAYNEIAPFFLIGALALMALELALRGTIWRQVT
jgi:Ca-activated chloride channel homolog